MPILTKKVEVKLNSMNIKYYEKLGYKVPMKKASNEYYRKTGKEFCYDLGKKFIVKVDDLQNGSDIQIDALCDYCNEKILTMSYGQYMRRTREISKIACKKCYPQKVKEVSILRYGVDNYAKTEECQRKMEATMQELYGVDSALQLPAFKAKQEQTCLDRYGVKHIMLNQDYKERIKNTCIERYGVDIPSKNPMIKEKIITTMHQNNTQKTSRQQLYLYNLYGGELNYPIKYYDIDICLTDEKIAIDYDGSGHDLSVRYGTFTRDEFTQREIVRASVIKKEGYKQMRIISLKDLLPSDAVLLQMLAIAKEYFNTTSHSWINFDIDNSTMINAENKDTGGVFFDYGKLRKIKEPA